MLERLEHASHRESIQYVRRFTPAAAGNANAKPHQGQMVGAVGISAHYKFHSQFHGASNVDIPQIKAVWHGIDLKRRARPGGRAKDCLHVQGNRLPLADEAASGMRQYVDMRILYGS